MIELLVLLAGAGLVLNARTSQAVVAYIVLAALATYFIFPATNGSPIALLLFVLSGFVKLIAAPLGVWLFVTANPATRDLRPSVPIAGRLLVVIAFAAAAHGVAAMDAFRGIGGIDEIAYVILCALGMLVIQRNLLAHILGLLALSAGVTLAGAVLAPGLPESVELGATFDAVVVTFIGLGLVRAFIVHNPVLDVESLRSLRG